MEKEFFDFLKSGSRTETFNYGNNSKMIVNKVKYNDKLDIIYILDGSDNNLFNLKNSFKYSGIYDKENNKLFDPEYSLRYNILNWDYGNEKYKSDSDLYALINEDMNETIKGLVETAVGDIFNIDEIEIGEEIDDKDVISDFMDGKTSETLENTYKEYSTENPKDLLDYLTDKESFLEEDGRDFILQNSTSILRNLAITREKKRVLKNIEENEKHPFHKIKSIIDAIKNNNCVTVKLTINKDGKEQTFRYNADTLKNNYNSSYLSTWGFENATERNLFEENFGRWGEFYYSDITKITYGKNIIYEDDNFKNKEEDLCLS